MPTILSGNPTGTNEESQDSAFKVGNPQIYNMPAPASLSANTTLTAQQILNGIVVASGTTTLTMPTAASLAAALRAISSRGVVAGDTVMCLISNGGAGTITLAANTGATFDANSGTTIVTGASRDVYLRFTNGTPGSEAYSIFS